MTEPVSTAPRTPGIVIFVAVLNFISMTFFILLALFAVTILIFGNVIGVYQYMTDQIAHYSPELKLGLGLNVIIGMLLFVSVLFSLFHLLTGIGLLKGKKIFWYIQIALSVLGLLGFPIATILNTVILVFFFQTTVRDYFRV